MQAHVYAMTKNEADDTPIIVIGILNILGMPARVLIDLRATHSFISRRFTKIFGRVPTQASYSYSVSIPTGEVIESSYILKACPINLANRTLFAELVVLGLYDFDIILGMDWRCRYHSNID